MKRLIATIVTLVLFLGLGYSAGIGYYAEKFQANTKFGSIDISNMTLAEAQEKIESDINSKEITLTENGLELGKLSMADVGGEVESTELLTATYNSQDPTLWLGSYFSGADYDNNLAETVQVDPTKVSGALSDLGITNEARQPATDARIDYTDAQGYFVQESSEGTQLDYHKLTQEILAAIQSGSYQVDLASAYQQPEVTSEDESIQSVMAEIEEALSTKITLTIQDEEYVIPREDIQKWMYFDANNQIVFDEQMIHDDIAVLNERYATYNQPRQFESTLQGTVTVEPGTLGWSIDREAEAAQIAADLQAGQDVTRMPNIVGTGYDTGGDEVGDSYVEIDLTAQRMFMYKNGQLVIETPIVSGMSGSSATVPGSYAIWNKERNATLEGTNAQSGNDYSQPVSYWLPFDDTGQGIHDANWQTSWTPDAYLYAGSQGCINTPPDVMANFFEEAELGMPVLIFF